MTLSLELLAQIMLNQVAWWNDTAIAALNPSIALPNALIKLVLPSTPCSATHLITQALSLVSSDFESTVRKRQFFSLPWHRD
jgi:phosphate transport system substrate-binding protein